MAKIQTELKVFNVLSARIISLELEFMQTKENGVFFQSSVPQLAVFADVHCQVGQTKNSQLL